MIILKDLVQGSEEWLKERKGVATCSEFSNIITPSKGEESKSLAKYAKKLALELLYDKLTENTFKSAAMLAGNELEAVARDLYQEKTFNLVEQVGFIKSDLGNFGFSPDGLVGEKGIIEIKCLEAEAHSEIILNNEMPLDYKCQVQGGLWISEREWCDFIAYNHYHKIPGKRLLIFRVKRDEEFIRSLAIFANKLILQRDSILKQLTKE
jgi:hypothetical protein